jgi:hypothetical protein
MSAVCGTSSDAKLTGSATISHDEFAGAAGCETATARPANRFAAEGWQSLSSGESGHYHGSKFPVEFLQTIMEKRFKADSCRRVPICDFVFIPENRLWNFVPAWEAVVIAESFSIMPRHFAERVCPPALSKSIGVEIDRGEFCKSPDSSKQRQRVDQFRTSLFADRFRPVKKFLSSWQNKKRPTSPGTITPSPPKNARR